MNKKIVPKAFGMSYEEFLKLYEETKAFKDEEDFDIALKRFCEKCNEDSVKRKKTKK